MGESMKRVFEKRRQTSVNRGVWHEKPKKVIPIVKKSKNCTCKNHIYEKNCVVHWTNFSKERYEEIIPWMKGKFFYKAGFSLRGVYDFDSWYKTMRKFFFNCCYEYPAMQYVWVKHLNFGGSQFDTPHKVEVHWHVLFWQDYPIDPELIRYKFAKMANKYTDDRYSIGDAYIKVADFPDGYLKYMLGLNSKQQLQGVPPWGALYGHVVDGNYSHKGKRLRGRRPL
jgi:hypothetical protein